VRSGRVSEARLDQSVLRILEAKARRGILAGAVAAPQPPATSVLNGTAHRALALDAARKAVTLQRDNAHLLPLSTTARVLVVTADAPTASDVRDDTLASNLAEAVRQFAPNATSATPRAAVTAASKSDVIVYGTFDLNQHAEQQALAKSLVATGKPVVVVSLRTPYDAAAAPEVGTVLTVYGDRPVHVQAAAEALFGKLTPSGKSA
jgi:beta-N-acetylhexosaminidase